MSAFANIQALFKRRYGPYVNPLPSENTMAKYASFVAQNVRPGENYNFPVQLGIEHGVTHNTDNSAFALNSVVDSVVKNAQLDGSTITIAGNIPYDVIAKSMNGEGGAYMEAMDYKVKLLMLSGEHYREANLLYGGGTGATLAAELAVVNASVSGANLAAPQVINITRATWSAGFWNNMTNALVDIYQSDGMTLRETEVTVQAQDPTKNRLTLFKSGSAATVAAGDKIILRSSKAKSAYGLQAILENTGTLFGIDAATYPQWRSINFSSGAAALTAVKIQQLTSRLKNNGLDGGGTLFVSAATFADLVDELDDRDRYIQQAGSALPEMKQTGANNITVKSPVGPVEIAVHKHMKQGIAMFCARDKVYRVGSTDLTFSLPGTNKWFYVELPSNAGAQIRVFTNQAPIITVPYHSAIVSSIVNAADTTPS